MRMKDIWEYATKEHAQVIHAQALDYYLFASRKKYLEERSLSI